jgi:hypothetical protein
MKPGEECKVSFQRGEDTKRGVIPTPMVIGIGERNLLKYEGIPIYIGMTQKTR